MVTRSRSTEHSEPVPLTQQQVEAARAGRGKHALGEGGEKVKRSPPARKPSTKRVVTQRKNS